jgi:hypothetical protein
MASKKEVDQKQLAALCRMKPSLEDAAAFFGVSADTIERRVKEWGYATFAEFRKENLVHTRFSLIRKALQKAENGDNTMLVFSLKNMCGWSEKVEEKQTSEINITIDGEDSKL